MKKSDITKKNILDYIKDNPGSSSTNISNFLGLTNVAIFYHIQKLLKDSLIYKTGDTRSTRYFIVEKNNNTKIPKTFFNNIIKELNEEYDGIENINIIELLDNLLAFLKPDGNWLYGIDAFIEKITRENSGKVPNNDLLHKRLVRFLLSFFEEERKRRKNGFFDGTESLRIIMNSYKIPKSIDKLLFTQIATLPHFGRLRGTTELFYGKQDQNKYLLEKAINRSIDTIIKYIKKNNITNIIFTPPTLKRKIQFREVLEDLLIKNNVKINKLSCEKIKSGFTHTLRPQKELKGYDRIINAKETIVVNNISKNIDNILIFDDSFTTGATINAIAEKIKKNGYTGNITAITIAGNFEYIPGITDEGEV